MIPVPTDLSWSLVKSSQRALTPNSQCLLGTPLTSDESPSADEHLTVIHILLVLMIFSFACQTWTSHVYQRWGDRAFVTREGSLSPLWFVSFLYTTASFWCKQGKLSKSRQVKTAFCLPLVPVAQSETALSCRRWQRMILSNDDLCANGKTCRGGFSLSWRWVGMLTLQ